MKTHRLLRETSLLMVCDVQEKFLPLVYGKEGILEAVSMAVRSAKILGLPIIVTEHTKKVMGDTCQEVKKHLNEKEDFIIEKTKFSMMIPQTNAVLETFPHRKQVLLVGMETQVCILQTCLDLIEKDYQVYILVDGITSIRSWERKVALKRLQKQGAILTTYESAVFDLLKDSKDQKFKQILAILKQSKRQNAINHL